MELIFIYNAHSGKINTLIDFTHKMVSPNTYQCQLCSLTYGNFGMKKDWKDFLNELDGKITFLYQDQLPNLNYTPSQIPCILVKINDNNIQEIISTKELNNCSNVFDLMNLLKRNYKSFL